jgi:hypothetical protein
MIQRSFGAVYAGDRGLAGHGDQLLRADQGGGLAAFGDLPIPGQQRRVGR